MNTNIVFEGTTGDGNNVNFFRVGSVGSNEVNIQRINDSCLEIFDDAPGLGQ